MFIISALFISKCDRLYIIIALMDITFVSMTTTYGVCRRV